MTKKLEEEFNLPSMDEATAKENAEATDKFDVADVTAVDIEDVQTALTNAEKIDLALQNVKGLDEHDEEMDDTGRMPKAARSFWVSQLYLGLMFLMALFASSGDFGSVIGSILAALIIVRSEKKYSETGNPFV